MNTEELFDPCDRYGSLTDKQAVGEKLSPDEMQWVSEHASKCSLCGAEGAFYAALPDIMRRVPSRPEIPVAAPPLRRRWLRPLVLVAAALTVVGVAAAEFVVHRPAARPPEPARVELVPAPAVEPTRAAAPAVAVPAEIPTETAPTAEPRRAAPPITDSVSADDLLREARIARAAGRPADAASAYKRLIQKFPASPQAGPARVSLGDLQLSLGDATGALASYDAYLGTGQGAIAREAHYGRIRALGALGRSADERREIEKFLRDYPSSSQAPALSAKLNPR